MISRFYLIKVIARIRPYSYLTHHISNPLYALMELFSSEQKNDSQWEYEGKILFEGPAPRVI